MSQKPTRQDRERRVEVGRASWNARASRCASALAQHLLPALLVQILVATGCVSAPAPRDPRPNILFVLVDDLGWGDLGLHDPALYSPHIDRLAGEGVWLDQHHVMPQCTPTRVALLTGRYPGRFSQQAMQASNEQSIPFDTPTLASLLQSTGYQTGIFGKWHLGSRPQQAPSNFGFEEAYGSLAGAVGAYDHRYRLDRPPYTDTWHRNGELIVDSESAPAFTQGFHVTDLITAEAVRFLDSSRSRPFFAYLAYTALHTPLAEEGRWFQDPEGKISSIEEADRRLMAAAIQHLDHSVGQLIEALERSGQRDNTIVVFCSDNGGIHGAYGGNAYPAPDPPLRAGFSSNAPLRGGKTTVYEGGTRVPAFVNWPARLAPGTLAAPMHIVDWLPTLTGLTGQQVDPEQLQLDGLDVWPQIAEGRAMPERELYIAWGSNWRELSLRRGDWKIESHDGGNQWQLFDLASDPGEQNDLIDVETARRDELLAALQAQRAADEPQRLVSCWIEGDPRVPPSQAFTVEVEFSEPVSGLSPEDFNLRGAQFRFLSGGPTSYELTLYPLAADSITVSVRAEVAYSVAAPARPNDRSSQTTIRIAEEPDWSPRDT